MSEIKVGDKVNISAEVISISGNLYNNKAELRFKNGYKIKVPVSAIDNEEEVEEDKRIVLHAIVQDIIMHEDQFTTIYVHGINSRTIYRFNSLEIDEGIIDLKEGDEVTIECEIIEDKFSYYYSSYIKGKTISDQIVTLHPEDCSYLILDNNSESEEDEKPNEDTDSDWINQTLQQCSRVKSIPAPVKITTQVPKVNNLIKDFALQAGDVHFTYRKDWALVDNHCLRTVSGTIYDKEVCVSLYNDLGKFPINNYGRIDLNGIYEYVMLSYLFNLPEYETDDKFNSKIYMLDKNSFLRIYPVYKDEYEKISIGKYECICATTEDIWNKYRFKDALEVYDKMNKTDWASKF